MWLGAVAGEVRDLPDADAHELIEGGWAEAADGEAEKPSAPGPEPEVEEVPAWLGELVEDEEPEAPKRKRK